MPEAASLERPTNREEDWRYSDVAAAAKLWPIDTERVQVAPGDRLEWQIVMAKGVEDAASQQIDQAFGSSAKATHRFDSSDIRENDAGIRQISVEVGEGAHFALHALLGGGRLNRLSVDVRLAKGAHFEFGGVTVSGGDATQEFVTRTIHAEPNGSSNQTVRAVHWGKSSGNFLGRIEVVKDAQKTDAAQNFRALLLEKGATANTKPELEIFADDVQCAHGAAIGQMDEMARYYMAARGIPPEAARKLLVQAFIGDAFVEMSDPEAAERMLEAALAHLDEAAI